MTWHFGRSCAAMKRMLLIIAVVLTPSPGFVARRRYESAALGRSWLGGTPNLRVYSRLNWLGLS